MMTKKNSFHRKNFFVLYVQVSSINPRFEISYHVLQAIESTEDVFGLEKIYVGWKKPCSLTNYSMRKSNIHFLL